MNNIQLKSLKHVSELLKKYDTYPVYSALSEVLKKIKVPNDESQNVLRTFQDEIYKVKKVIEESQDWISTIIIDEENNNNK